MLLPRLVRVGTFSALLPFSPSSEPACLVRGEGLVCLVEEIGIGLSLRPLLPSSTIWRSFGLIQSQLGSASQRSLRTLEEC